MRYIVYEGSKSGHCCFEATVIDNQHKDEDCETVCECFDMKSAEKIVKALNNSE